VKRVSTVKTTVVVAIVVAAILPAGATALPDHRAYELVTRFTEGGREVGMGGVEAESGLPSVTGEALDWGSLGACCGATAGAGNLYQSERLANGWQTRSVTPPAGEGLDGLFEGQAPVFITNDLQQSVWATPLSYTPGDHRPKYAEDYDLYLQGPEGSLKWLTQGPFGTGSGHYSAEFDAATPDANEVVFSSAEQLTANATGLASLNRPPQYLYVRNVAEETTTLIDVNNNNELISPDGAALGNGDWLNENLIPSDYEGTTTNAISADGTKVFFESPTARSDEVPEGVVPHLYMRDLADDTTTALDDPSSSSSAQYEGAGADGSLVFFTSSEGLDGAPTATELYEFNTTSSPIGPAPPMSAIPITTDAGGIVGISAIANDGSRVYFVADEALASNTNPLGHTALAGQPNLYVYDTASGGTTFVTTLASPDVSSCDFTCASTGASGLVAEPDVARPAYPTPTGEVFVFASTGDITGEAQEPTTKLTAQAETGTHTLSVESTAGFLPNRTIAIDTGAAEELATVEAVDSPTELTLSEYEPSYNNGLYGEHAAGATVTELYAQYYRYSSAEDSLVCISCTPAGVVPSGSANLGGGGGGSYAPPGQTTPMSEDGSRIFFASPNQMVPEVQTVTSTNREPNSVYEWEHGHVSLISNGSSINAGLDGTTPSGNDVFIVTRAELIPGAMTGSDQEIYDARVEGGFPAPTPEPPCEGSNCRPPVTTTTMFSSVPASATLGADVEVQGVVSPMYAVTAVTAAQRRHLARTGSLTVTVTATASGEIAASAMAKVHGKTQRVAYAEATLAKAGKIALALHLSNAARAQLARAKTLTLHLEISYSQSPTVKLAELTLHAPARVAALRRRRAGHA
jgi:hypothetical protein